MNSCFWGDVRMKELKSCSVTVSEPGPLAQHAASQTLRGQGLQLRKTIPKAAKRRDRRTSLRSACPKARGLGYVCCEQGGLRSGDR